TQPGRTATIGQKECLDGEPSKVSASKSLIPPACEMGRFIAHALYWKQENFKMQAMQFISKHRVLLVLSLVALVMPAHMFNASSSTSKRIGAGIICASSVAGIAYVLGKGECPH